jgi:hypothetical protein
VSIVANQSPPLISVLICQHLHFYQSRLFAMDRSKIVAVVTGIISIALAIAYLLIVQIIDFRGEMLPAPIVETIVQKLLIA